MAPMNVAAADRFLRRVAHQERTLGRGERRHHLVQEIGGSDSDPNVARLTGSAEVLPLAGATGERGAAGPDPLVGRMGCYPPEIRPVLRRRVSEAATWIAALKGLASEIRFRPGRHSLNLNAAVDLDEHEAHVVAKTPK